MNDTLQREQWVSIDAILTYVTIDFFVHLDLCIPQSKSLMLLREVLHENLMVSFLCSQDAYRCLLTSPKDKLHLRLWLDISSSSWAFYNLEMSLVAKLSPNFWPLYDFETGRTNCLDSIFPTTFFPSFWFMPQICEHRIVSQSCVFVVGTAQSCHIKDKHSSKRGE